MDEVSVECFIIFMPFQGKVVTINTEKKIKTPSTQFYASFAILMLIPPVNCPMSVGSIYESELIFNR